MDSTEVGLLATHSDLVEYMPINYARLRVGGRSPDSLVAHHGNYRFFEMHYLCC